jgi:hypothetical protein
MKKVFVLVNYPVDLTKNRIDMYWAKSDTWSKNFWVAKRFESQQEADNEVEDHLASEFLKEEGLVVEVRAFWVYD